MQHITGNKALVFLLHILSIMACLSAQLCLRSTTEIKLSVCIFPLSEVLTRGKTPIDKFSTYDLEHTSGALKAIFTMELTYYSIKAIFTWRQESSLPAFHCWFAHDKILLESASTPLSRKKLQVSLVVNLFAHTGYSHHSSAGQLLSAASSKDPFQHPSLHEGLAGECSLCTASLSKSQRDRLTAPPLNF